MPTQRLVSSAGHQVSPKLFDFAVQLGNSFVRLLHPTVSLRQLQIRKL
jgi:hypothetical protein